LSHTDEFIVENKLCEKDCCKILFKSYIVFGHREIVRKFLDPNFAKSVGGTVTLKDFVVTVGGFETMDGFQHTAFFSPQAGKRTEHSGTEYPIKLASDECISKLDFVLIAPAKSYSFIVSSNCLEIRPKPSRQIVRICIRGLKEAFAESPRVFLQSAETKFASGLIDFLGGRYRSVPHNIYYATHDLVKCLSVLSGMDSDVGHDKKTQKRLTDLLNQIASGKHKELAKSLRWKEEEGHFRLISPRRYSKLVTDLYEMRSMADYNMAFEIGEFIPELSNLMLRVEELFTLVMYVESASVATTNGTLVQIFQPERELEPFGNLVFHRPERNAHWILQKGLILAESFDLNKFLAELLRKRDIYYSPFRPGSSRRRLYVKCEKKSGTWTHSLTFSEEIAKEGNYVPYTIEAVKKLSRMTKADELRSLEKNQMLKARSVTFSDGKYLFELYVSSDGRFHLFSCLEERNATDQMSAVLRLREMMAKVVSSLWKHQSTISFSAITITQRAF